MLRYGNCFTSYNNDAQTNEDYIVMLSFGNEIPGDSWTRMLRILSVHESIITSLSE